MGMLVGVQTFEITILKSAKLSKNTSEIWKKNKKKLFWDMIIFHF
jgi:hypothetical protein